MAKENNYVILSYPETAEEELVLHYATLSGKTPGSFLLHTPEILGTEFYPWAVDVPTIITEQTHVLSGYWHTIENLDETLKQYIKDNYTIVTINRNMDDMKAAVKAIILSNFESESACDAFIENGVQLGEAAKSNWTVDITHDYDEFVNSLV